MFFLKILNHFSTPLHSKKNKLHFCKCLKTVLSKTTFYQNFECISLKVLDTGSLQIFANPCKFASQLWQKICLQIPFHFLGKMSLPHCIFFNLNFWYKLTQLMDHSLSTTAVLWRVFRSVKTWPYQFNIFYIMKKVFMSESNA